MIDKEIFFREITLRICSSLEINVAIERVFGYLKEHLPLDAMGLDILDPKLGTIRHVARYPANKTKSPEILALPEKLWTWAQGLREPVLMDSLPVGDLGMEMIPLVKMEGNSDLVLPLRIERKLVGLLILRARGERRYGCEHAKLLEGVMKPFALALANAMAHEEMLSYRNSLVDDNRFLKEELKKFSGLDEVVGASAGLRHVMELVHQVAPLANKVLLLGETGTGKEVIANAIHSLSPRAEGPFVKVNCGAIPESLIDSELFGHEKGAFSGAIAGREGRFERADGGTLFLDEIGELPPQAQTRLLRVLQNQKVERVGGSRLIHVDARIIVATHQNLERLVQEGRFREDLWYRLNVFPITIPPLRQRTEDVPALTRYFLSTKSRELGLRKPPPISPGALQRLMHYRWPGNVRELENLVERELIRNRDGTLTFDSLLPDLKAAKTSAAKAALPPQANLDEAMTSHIVAALEAAKGKIHGPGGAAEILGINANTLRNRMNKLGILYGKKKKHT
jgi:hydrogenase-4 transcriptional activator